MQAKINKVNTFKEGIDLAKYIYDTQPVINSQVLDDIDANFSGTTATVTTYAYGSGAFTVTALATNNHDPAKVVENFVKQDIFDNITYTGFAATEAEDAVGNGYTFTVSFDMRKVEPVVEEDTSEKEAE